MYRFIAAAILFVNVAFAGEAKVPGVVDFKTGDGRFATKRAQLTVPEGWRGPLSITSDGKTLASDTFRFVRDGQRTELVAAFTAANGAAVIFSGPIVGGKSYTGRAYTRAFPAPEKAETALAAYLEQDGGWVPVGSFRFGRSNRRTTVSTDRNNPCPNGPCWTTGGVGRYAEFYAGGPIQNPGRPSVAAGFERGLPYALTRQGQLEAQRVGIERARQLQRSHYANTWGWGFGWIWW